MSFINFYRNKKYRQDIWSSCQWMWPPWPVWLLWYQWQIFLTQMRRQCAITSYLWCAMMQRSTNAVHPKDYAHDLRFVMFCCGLVRANLPHALQAYFACIRQSYGCPNSRTTLKYMDILIIWSNRKYRNTQKKPRTMCIFYGMYCDVTATRPFHSNCPI